METSTINQLIESLGFVATSFIIYVVLNQLYTLRHSIKFETLLLKDIIFLRLLIQKYRDKTKENLGQSCYNSFRKDVIAELGYNTSPVTKLSAITKRLEDLDELDIYISSSIKNIKPS